MAHWAFETYLFPIGLFVFSCLAKLEEEKVLYVESQLPAVLSFMTCLKIWIAEFVWDCLFQCLSWESSQGLVLVPGRVLVWAGSGFPGVGFTWLRPVPQNCPNAAMSRNPSVTPGGNHAAHSEEIRISPQISGANNPRWFQFVRFAICIWISPKFSFGFPGNRELQFPLPAT